MTAVDPAALDAEIRDRIAANVAASAAQRDARRQLRAESSKRREAGLRQRHARKLNRGNAPASVPRSAPRAAAPVGPADPRTRGVPVPAEREQLRASLGAVLRRERAAAGLSQRRLAGLAGCHPRTVERLEAGQLRPTSAILAALAHALAVPPGYSVNRAAVAELVATLTVAAGPSVVASTPGSERRRRRRLRKARLVANAAALPVLRARHGMSR